MYDQISPLYADEMSATRSISVVDVYDIAASIGKEFETLIDTYGPQAVTELMPKVINILEHLEGLAGINQKEDAEIQELRFAVKQLQSEKSAKAEERERYEKELEQIEDSWRKETTELVQSVNRLREDKRQLQMALQEQEGHTIKLQQAEEEISVLTKMKETVDRQREELRVLKREATQKASDLEAAQAQSERLTNLNAEYRRKSNMTQRQSKQLIQDKAELQAQLHDRDQDLGRYKDRVARQDSQEGNLTPLSDDELEKMINRLQREGKMVVDLADPHRPRFSINELQDVLQEKNELKTKLIEAEEELAHYKGEPDPVSFRPATADSEEEAPVQGPINREPLDKLYPDYKEDSGIRRLFKFLVGNKQGRRESLKMGAFRRSSMK